MAKHMKVTQNNAHNNIRFETGLTVLDEALYRGHYLVRYWSPSGQVLPEMHLREDTFFERANGFPIDSFILSVNGNKLTRFSLVSQGEYPDDSGLFSEGPVKVWKTRLDSLETDIAVTVCTRLDGSEFLVRWLEIENCSCAPIGIDSVYPFAGRVWLHDSTPFKHAPSIRETAEISDFDLAYCKKVDWGCEGDFLFEPLKPGVFRFDGGRQGRSGWSRPAFWLRDNQSGQIMAVEFAYSGNWEFQIHIEKTEKTVQAGACIGIPAIDGEYIRVLGEGECVRTPAVHVALFPHCSLDRITQSFHTHIRNTVMPQPPKGREVEVEANHRGYLCDQENEAGILADIDVAQAIGAELYVIDAGWYGPLPNKWWDNVGDWYYGQWLPNGLKPIADYVHSKGMKFGLWIEIEALGANAKLGQQHPEWRMMRGEDYCAPYESGVGGRALDLSRPDVISWIEQVVSRYIEELGLDMYRIDHNHCMGQGGYRDKFGLRENVLWTYYENFYRLHRSLRNKYPDVVFQNCAGGGGRLDFGMLNCFHNTEASDWARPPRVGKIFNNLSMILPPERMLCIFGTETLGLEMEYDLFSQLCAILGGRPIFRGIAPSIMELNPLLQEEIRSNIDYYKTNLRDILHEADVFHHTPMLPIFEPANYSAIEYASKSRHKIFILVRSLNPTSDNRIQIFPRSIRPDASYKITLIKQGVSWKQEGIALLNQGILLKEDLTEIVMLEKVSALS